ncbi:methionyl-tRNA formyltransferase [Agromyces archimandritae]|uniref:Methionyl-tRNA formyltransferase n=1 Tax=Agromyces archimandritae TaxID=2781962 RepID=A0A975INH8_9MICO|nr:methionyl-tRNA formyltransferase [Agromyces archimandritae]QTX04628.1 methionyl-tRNA formyltransferase [Agromyces archimandritae]
MPRLRIVFAGTPDAAVPSLERLAGSGHEIVGVVTRPDAPLGRKRVMTPSPVARAADALALPVLKTARLDDAATAAIAAWRPELGVIVAYGGLVREPLLSQPAHGWVNLHFSLLPAWRGAAPVQRALIAGDETTGAAVFRLVPELDAGAVYGTIERATGQATAGELLARLADDGAELLERVVDEIAESTAVAEAQEGEPTFAPKLGIDDGRLDWSRPAAELLARYRGVTPEPGAWTTTDGARLKVLALAPAVDAAAPPTTPGTAALDDRRALVAAADGPLELLRVQPAGKPAMNGADWLRGRGGEAVLG